MRSDLDSKSDSRNLLFRTLSAYKELSATIYQTTRPWGLYRGIWNCLSHDIFGKCRPRKERFNMRIDKKLLTSSQLQIQLQVDQYRNKGKYNKSGTVFMNFPNQSLYKSVSSDLLERVRLILFIGYWQTITRSCESFVNGYLFLIFLKWNLYLLTLHDHLYIIDTVSGDIAQPNILGLGRTLLDFITQTDLDLEHRNLFGRLAWFKVIT